MNRDLFLTKDYDSMRVLVRKSIEDKKNYFGTGDNSWTLTENLMGTDRLSILILNLLCGTEVNGTRAVSGAKPPVKTIKLKVLTRQACSADAEGNLINGTLMGVDKFLVDGPQEHTEPVEGDYVLVKGDRRTKEDLGIDPIPENLRAMEMRHQHEKFRWVSHLRNHYTDYQVDADGCIAVEPAHAIQLLRRNGENIVFPKYRSVQMTDKKTRVRTNWFFREVPPDFTETKKIAAPPQAEQPEIAPSQKANTAPKR